MVANVFDICYTYPHITSTSTLPQSIPPREQQPATTGKRKDVTVKKSEVPIKKRKASPVKKRVQRTTKKRKLQNKSKSVIKKKPRKPRKQPVYKPKFIREIHHSEEEEEEPLSDNEGSYEEDDMTSNVSEQGVDLSDNEGPPGESFNERLLRIAMPSVSKNPFQRGPNIIC